MLQGRVPAPRFACGLLLALVMPACAGMLGIDGDYVEQSEPATNGHGGAKPSASGGTKGDGGEPGAGGSGDSAGAGGSGDVTGAGGAGGVPDESGGTTGAGGDVPVDAGTVDTSCRTGHYQGKFSGHHNTALAVGFGDQQTRNGVISFDLVGSTTPLDLANATVKADIAWGNVSGTLTGTYECDTHQLVAHLSMQLTIPPALSPLDGTLSGDLFGAASGRTWTEKEPSAKNPPVGFGDGTWTVSYVGP